MATLDISVSFKRRPERIITSIAVCQAEEVRNIYGGSSKIIKTDAMWDTGANGCCITHNLARALNLIKITDRPVGSIQGVSEAPVYGIDIALPDGRPLASVPVTGFDKWGAFDIIIGTAAWHLA